MAERPTLIARCGSPALASDWSLLFGKPIRAPLRQRLGFCFPARAGRRNIPRHPAEHPLDLLALDESGRVAHDHLPSGCQFRYPEAHLSKWNPRLRRDLRVESIPVDFQVLQDSLQLNHSLSWPVQRPSLRVANQHRWVAPSIFVETGKTTPFLRSKREIQYQGSSQWERPPHGRRSLPLPPGAQSTPPVSSASF